MLANKRPILFSFNIPVFLPFVLLAMLIFFPFPVVGDTSNVPKTGQTISTATGDDGDLQKGVSWPEPRFTDNDDGTVTDVLTNLTWLKNANCFNTLNLSDALVEASTLHRGNCSLADDSIAGDWRLPNVRELESLIHSGAYSPAVPNTIGTGQATADNPFTSLQLNEYWSSSTNTAMPAQGLAVSMRWGHILSKNKSTLLYSMFVRDSSSGSPVAAPYSTGQTLCYTSSGTVINCTGTGQDGETGTGMSWPIPRFIDNGDGTVLDKLSGLTWLQNANCWGISSWASAVSLVNQLATNSCGLNDGSLAGDWRLPNRKELLSLIDYNVSSPALSDTVGTDQWQDGDPFSGVEATGYWSSTSYKGVSGYAWYVDLQTGIIGTDSKSTPAYVWAVFASTISVTLAGDGSGTVTSSPDGISCPGTCSSEFARSSTVTLTALANKGSGFAGWSIGSCGKQATCTVNLEGPVSVTATFVENSATVGAWIILLLEKL